ncbi:MAG: hypothetical protein KC609_23380 [Myxococcales bacterium]|nr:hypothetical protein [Myxococcales bacterium]
MVKFNRITLIVAFATACLCAAPGCGSRTKSGSLGSGCGSDKTCGSGFCDSNVCARVAGQYGSVCTDGASLQTCGSYVCQNGLCRSCDSDEQCVTLGLGDVCEEVEGAGRRCATVLTGDTSNPGDSTSTDTTDDTVPDAPADVNTPFEGTWRGRCANNTGYELSFSGDKADITIILFSDDPPACTTPVVRVRFHGTARLGSEVNTTNGKTATELDLTIESIHVALLVALSGSDSQTSANNASLCSLGTWTTAEKNVSDVVQCCYFEPKVCNGTNTPDPDPCPGVCGDGNFLLDGNLPTVGKTLYQILRLEGEQLFVGQSSGFDTEAAKRPTTLGSVPLEKPLALSAACSEDLACESNFCENGACTSPSGELGKLCIAWEPAFACGSLICRGGRCHACQSDQECITAGNGNRCVTDGTTKSCTTETTGDVDPGDAIDSESDLEPADTDAATD